MLKTSFRISFPMSENMGGWEFSGWQFSGWEFTRWEFSGCYFIYFIHCYRWVCASGLESDLDETDKIAAEVLRELAADEKCTVKSVIYF